MIVWSLAAVAGGRPGAGGAWAGPAVALPGLRRGLPPVLCLLAAARPARSWSLAAARRCVVTVALLVRPDVRAWLRR